MLKPTTVNDVANFFEGRVASFLLSAVLFAANFLIFYFLWISVFPNMTGLIRLAVCWVGAYAMTWIMTLLAKGLIARCILTLFFIGLSYIVLMHKP